MLSAFRAVDHVVCWAQPSRLHAMFKDAHENNKDVIGSVRHGFVYTRCSYASRMDAVHSLSYMGVVQKLASLRTLSSKLFEPSSSSCF